MKGKVYIIGVGPGDYKLMTLKAVECIGKADVLVYDRLVGSRVLSFAKEDAELVYVGKMPDNHAVPQGEINRILVEKALEGKTVARVKGGDPFVFGRGGEEAEALCNEGIEFEIVPGITSAIAVPAYAGIPVTHRDFCSSFHVITGHERPDKEESMLDYETLAKLEGTLVFLMGIRNLKAIAENLVRCGKDSLTPAAVIEKGTTSQQRLVSGTLADIAGKVEAAGIKSPAVTVVGKVAGLGEKLAWLEKRKLSGKRILVTRAREQAGRLAGKIEEFGGEAIEVPTIRITGPDSFEAFDSALDRLDTFGWLVFTSTNGVQAFFRRMKTRHIDIRRLAGIKICAVGEATEGELSALGLNAEYVPESYNSESLLKGLLEKIVPGEKILLARADIAGSELPMLLKDSGMELEDLIVYKTVLNHNNRDEIIKIIEDGSVDLITFTSSSTVKNLVSIIGEENTAILANTRVACIGPVTAAAAQELGIRADIVADRSTIEGLIDKIIERIASLN